MRQIDLSAARQPATKQRAQKMSDGKLVAGYVLSTLRALAKSRDGRAKLTEADLKRLKANLIRVNDPRVAGRKAVVIGDADSSFRKSDFEIMLPAVSVLSGLHRNFPVASTGGMMDVLWISVLYVDEPGMQSNPKLGKLRLESDRLGNTSAEYRIDVTIFGDAPKGKAKVAADLLRQVHVDNKAQFERLLNVDLYQQMVKRLMLGTEVQKQVNSVANRLVEELNDPTGSDAVSFDVPVGAINKKAQVEAEGIDPDNPKDQRGVFGSNFARLLTVVRTAVRTRLEMQLVNYAFKKGAASPTFVGFKALAARQRGPIGPLSKVGKQVLGDAIAQVGPSRKVTIYQPDPTRLMGMVAGANVAGQKGTTMRGVFGASMQNPRFVARLYAQVDALYPLVVYEALKELLDADSGLSVLDAGYKLPRKAPEVLDKMYKGFIKDSETKRVVMRVLAGAKQSDGQKDTLSDLKDKHADALPEMRKKRQTEARKAKQLLEQKAKETMARLKAVNAERLARGRQTAAENRTKKRMEKLAKAAVKEETKRAEDSASPVAAHGASSPSLFPAAYATVSQSPSGGFMTPNDWSMAAPPNPARNVSAKQPASKKAAFTAPKVAQPASLGKAVSTEIKRQKEANPALRLSISVTAQHLAERLLKMPFSRDVYGNDKASPLFSGLAMVHEMFKAYSAAYPAAGMTLEKFKRLLTAADKANLLHVRQIDMARFDRMRPGVWDKERELISRIIVGGRLLGSTVQLSEPSSLATLIEGIQEAYLSLTAGEYGTPVALTSLMNHFDTGERETVRAAVMELRYRLPNLTVTRATSPLVPPSDYPGEPPLESEEFTVTITAQII